MLLTMDVSLLSSPATEYTNQRALACFSVGSANSPSSSLTRRPGIRRDRAEEVEKRGKQTGAVGSSKRGRLIDGQDPQTGLISEFQGRAISGLNEEKELSPSSVSSSLTHKDKIEKKTTDFGINRSLNYNPASESHTGTEWRRNNLPIRSRSVDWRSGARSPGRGTRRSDISEWSTEENKQGGWDASCPRGRSLLSFRTSALVSTGTSSPKSPTEQTLEAIDGGSSSLPLRLKSASEATWDPKETGSFGTKRSQSILERIEKLYGSSKSQDFNKVRAFASSERGRCDGKVVLNILPSFCDEAVGGTFPRRGSAGERSYYSPVDINGSFTRTLQDSSSAGFNSSTVPRTRARLPEGQWQERIYRRYSDIGAVNGGKESIKTMSLDRARSRNTLACQIRMARTAQSNTLLLEQTSASREGSGSMDLGRVNWEKENNETTRISVTQTTFTPEKGKVTEVELREYHEDVFESHLQNSRANTAGYKVYLETQSPSMSVRNKISQFEALTLRSQGFKTVQTAMPRRAFSVPTQLYSAHDSMKSESTAGNQGDKYMGLLELGGKDRKAEDKVGEVQLKNQSQRSVSVDTVKYFGDLSTLKHTHKSPLKEDTNFFVYEPDHGKVSSNKDWGTTNSELSSNPDPHTYAELSGKKAKPGVIILSITDDDKTPTNTPNHSPLCSLVSVPTKTSPFVQTEKESQQQPSNPKRPLASSSHGNLADLMFPDVFDGGAKGKKQMVDLNAWVAGWKAWRDDNDGSDDDTSTQKDADSNYDSDSGESSVTITSNMSLSERRSFSVSLAELCYFTGTDYESEADDEWSAALGNRSASLSSDMSALSYVSVLPTEELDKLLEDVRGLRDSDLQDNVHVVVLHKEMAVGLGFSIAGGVDQNKPVTVHKVFPSGVAAQEGSIREGDQVLSINGTALERHTHWEALRVLRRAKTREMGVVVLRRGVVGSISKEAEDPTKEVLRTQTSETGQRMKVRLEKKSRDLGFSLEGGVGLGDKPLTIKKIFQGGPVDKICPGDEVMEIEGVSIVGMRRLEAWTLIRRLPSGPVDVVILRPCKAPEL